MTLVYVLNGSVKVFSS